MSSGIVESSSHGSESQQQQQPPSRSKLVQRLLSASANLPAFVNDLLTTQAVVVAGTEAAGFLIERGEDQFSLRPIAHIRPDSSGAETRAAAMAAFQEIAKPCVAQGKDGAIEINAPGETVEPQFCLVTLLRNEGEVVAVSAVITRCRDLERAQQRLMSMQLVAGYFDLYTLRRNSDSVRVIAQSHQHVLQLATAVATAEGFQSAANNFCNELATRTGAARVSLGWLKGRNIKIKALSHTEQFDKKQELIVQLQGVMEECLDQEEPVHFDAEGGSSANVTRSAQVLSRAQGGHIVLSLPLRRRDDIVGVVTLEFLPQQRLGAQAAAGLGVAVDLLAPQLYDRFHNDRWLITKAGISLRETAKLAIGPKHMLAKLLITLGITTVLVLCDAVPYLDLRMMHRVSAPFAFAAIQKRTISAPFEGTIKKVFKFPGDEVSEGEVLLQLDISTLQIEKAKATARHDTAIAEAQKYYADKSKIPDYNIALAQADEAKAEADLYEDRIQRSTIKAPFKGQVLRGDLRDKIDAVVKQGDELFELAQVNRTESSGKEIPLNLRAELSVAERDIQYLQEGQAGHLATTSLPTSRFPFKVDRIVPVGKAEEGNNVFTVHVELTDKAPAWRPGMAGEARVDIQKRPIIWIWTHRVIEFVRLKLWI